MKISKSSLTHYQRIGGEEKVRALVHEIVTAPETLHSRVEEYLQQLRELESCAI